jgi:RHS repeat-associated protein
MGLRPSIGGYGLPDGTIQRFSGKERDAESGLDYFLARYYSGAQGRFTSVDPDNRGAIEEDPQTWNAYSYVRNNPLKYTDPDGTDVRVCVDNGNGGQNCVFLKDPQYADLYDKQNGQQGITLPGGETPTGNITCGGQICGTATYYEPEKGLESHDIVNFAIGGLFKAGIEGTAALLNNLIGAGAKQVAATAAEGVIANGTKQAVREALERSALSNAQKAAVRRALARGAAGDKFAVEKLADGSIKVVTEVAGRTGGRATYEKIIDAAGNTISVVQKAFDAAGKLVHEHSKFP